MPLKLARFRNITAVCKRSGSEFRFRSPRLASEWLKQTRRDIKITPGTIARNIRKELKSTEGRETVLFGYSWKCDLELPATEEEITKFKEQYQRNRSNYGLFSEYRSQIVVSDLLERAGFETEVMWTGCKEADMLVWRESTGKSHCLRVQLKASVLSLTTQSYHFTNCIYPDQFVICCGFTNSTQTIFWTNRSGFKIPSSFQIRSNDHRRPYVTQSDLVDQIETEFGNCNSVMIATYHDIYNSYNHLKASLIRNGIKNKIWVKELIRSSLGSESVIQCDYHNSVTDFFVINSRCKVIGSSSKKVTSHFRCTKSLGLRRYQPCQYTDFDFLIAVIRDAQMEEHPVKFIYVIPSAVLSSEKFAVLTTPQLQGKKAFCLDPYNQIRNCKYRDLNQFMIPSSQFDNPQVWEFLKQEYFNPDLINKLVRKYPPISTILS